MGVYLGPEEHWGHSGIQEEAHTLARHSWGRGGGTCTRIPEVPQVLSHVHTEVVLPLGDVATLGAHVVLGVGVGEHVLGQVAHISAREVAQLTLVRFLTLGQGEGGGRSGDEKGENPDHTQNK